MLKYWAFLGPNHAVVYIDDILVKQIILTGNDWQEDYNWPQIDVEKLCIVFLLSVGSVSSVLSSSHIVICYNPVTLVYLF